MFLARAKGLMGTLLTGEQIRKKPDSEMMSLLFDISIWKQQGDVQVETARRQLDT